MIEFFVDSLLHGLQQVLRLFACHGFCAVLFFIFEHVYFQVERLCGSVRKVSLFSVQLPQQFQREHKTCMSSACGITAFEDMCNRLGKIKSFLCVKHSTKKSKQHSFFLNVSVIPKYDRIGRTMFQQRVSVFGHWNVCRPCRMV